MSPHTHEAEPISPNAAAPFQTRHLNLSVNHERLSITANNGSLKGPSCTFMD